MTFLPNHEVIDLECGLACRPHTSNRRQQERELILAFDSKELRRHEAWFLIETKWLDAWGSYVLGDDDDAIAPKRPGPLTNDSLLNRDEFCIRNKLQLTKDYRGVNPQVYALYAELYGTSDAKPIVRWSLDIYAMPVMIDDIRDMLHVPKLKARSLVAEINEGLERNEKRLFQGLQSLEPKESWMYRCLCRCEFLVPCLNQLLGGGPTYEKKTTTKWSDYFCCCRKRKNKNTKRRRSKKRGEEKTRDDEEDETSDAESFSSSDEETHELLG